VTLPGQPPGPRPGDPGAERILAQALRAMAGDGRQPRAPDEAQTGGHLRLTRLQILLIAVIAGLLIGITIGLLSLLS
jgi:hypothetical protein